MEQDNVIGGDWRDEFAEFWLKIHMKDWVWEDMDNEMLDKVDEFEKQLNENLYRKFISFLNLPVNSFYDANSKPQPNVKEEKKASFNYGYNEQEFDGCRKENQELKQEQNRLQKKLEELMNEYMQVQTQSEKR